MLCKQQQKKRLCLTSCQMSGSPLAADGALKHLPACYRWSVPELAVHFRIRQQRVMAILALKEMEREEVSRSWYFECSLSGLLSGATPVQGAVQHAGCDQML